MSSSGQACRRVSVRRSGPPIASRAVRVRCFVTGARVPRRPAGSPRTDGRGAPDERTSERDRERSAGHVACTCGRGCCQRAGESVGLSVARSTSRRCFSRRRRGSGRMFVRYSSANEWLAAKSERCSVLGAHRRLPPDDPPGPFFIGPQPPALTCTQRRSHVEACHDAWPRSQAPSPHSALGSEPQISRSRSKPAAGMAEAAAAAAMRVQGTAQRMPGRRRSLCLRTPQATGKVARASTTRLPAS